MSATSLFPLALRPFALLMGFLLATAAAFAVEISRFSGGGAFFASLFLVPGESLLLKLPHGHRVLVDAGETPDVVGKLAKQLPFGDRSLDAVVLTHGDRDHIGGMPAILQAFSVGTVLLPGTAQTAPLPKTIKNLLSERNIPTAYMNPEADFTVGGVRFDVLAPLSAPLGKDISKQNSASVVIRVSGAGKSLLLTGDIEAAEEKRLVRAPIKLHADILKVPHHGSKTSSTPAFIAAVRPQTAAAIAYPDNRFGHPHQEVVNRYQNLYIPLLVTRDIGDINLPIHP